MCVGRDFLMHDEAAHGRQREVEHNQVGRVVMEPVEGSGTIARFFDRVARDCEHGAEHPAQIVIVLNDQDHLRRRAFTA